MFPDEVFLTLCCPKGEITEAYSIGETAINIPALEGAPIPIEIELTSTSLIGDLKDRLNIILGEIAGFSRATSPTFVRTKSRRARAEAVPLARTVTTATLVRWRL